ncbi:MAG: TetR/AcrR family transcriptional regulator [Caulobacteraceae bacterium]
MSETQRQKQKNLTRKHIIEAAIKQYAAIGLTKTRTADIAKAANVSHGTIFAHFSTQEELLIAVIDEFGSRINMRLHELASGKSGVHEVLEAHLEGLIEFEDFYTKLVIESRLLPKIVRNTFIMIQSTISFHLSQAVEREIKAGSILPLPIYMIFNGWVGLVHYYLINSDLFSPGESVLKRYGQDLLVYYMNLITQKN